MARCYYATRLSENISETPEGYLICQNVPIARTGWQEYLGSELKLATPGMVQVYRDPVEVFSEACLASFESKAVVDQHPQEWLNQNNTGNYQRGHTRNVRRGIGEFADCIVADLIIMDSNLIAKIKGGIREVSCGYDCIYVPLDDTLTRFSQTEIRGNHTAVVGNGRAGERIAIRDSKPERGEIMSVGKDLRKYIFGLGFKSFAKDAEPEAIANAIEATKEGEERMENRNKDAAVAPPVPGGPPAPAAPAAPEGSGGDIGQALMKIITMLEQLMTMEKHEQAPTAQAPVPEPEDALDALANELEGKPPMPPPQAADSGLMEPVMTLPPEDRPKNPIPGAEKSVDAATIRALKPIIAGIKNKDERKRVVDALMASYLRPSTMITPYGSLLHGQRIQSETKDGKLTQPENVEDFGKQIKEKYHRKSITK